MKLNLFGTLSIAATLAAPLSAYAFQNGDVISFDPGVTTCSSYGSCRVNSGSYFAIDTDGNGRFSATERTAMVPGPDGGIVLGALQPGPGIDEPWSFFGALGYHRTTVTPITQNTDGSLNFSGLEVYWNNTVIPFGSGIKSTVTCGGISPCTVNDPYKIDYTSQVSSGPFFGIKYLLHLEHINTTPALDVSLSIDGGHVQECAAIGGHVINATASVKLLNGAQLSSIQWTVDGQIAGTGSNLSTYLTLGTHSIAATATAVSGQQDTETTSVTIVDTVAPTINASFVDNRTGSVISTVTTKNTSFVGVRMSAIDTCDAYPSTSAIGGFSLKDGDTLKIQGNLDKVELTTSVLQMEVKAMDVSGNASQVNKALSITP